MELEFSLVFVRQTIAGLGIRSLVFRANCLFFDKKEQIALSLFLKRAIRPLFFL